MVRFLYYKEERESVHFLEKGFETKVIIVEDLDPYLQQRAEDAPIYVIHYFFFVTVAAFPPVAFR